MRFYLHSFTFRNYSIDHALRKAAELDWDGLELHTKHFDESKFRDELTAIIEKATRFRVDVAVLDFSANFIADDPAVREQSVNKLREMIPIAREFGISVMNGYAGFLTGSDPRDFGSNGSALATDEHYDRATEALRQIAPIAEREGMTLTLEIHMNTIHDTAETALRLIDAVNSPALRVNFDPGNMFATPTAEDPLSAIQKLKGKLGLCHLKNCVMINGKPDFSVPLESGHIDYYKILEALLDTGYDDLVSIEYCGQGDPNVPAARDIAYARRTLNDITSKQEGRSEV